MSLPVIAFCILTSVPSWAVPDVYAGVYAFRPYASFRVVEDCSDPETTSIEFARVQGEPIGLAYAIRWGHEQNLIQIDRTFPFQAYPNLLARVVEHEAAHIWIAWEHSANPDDLLYPYAWRYDNLRLGWYEMNGLRERWGRVRPIPPQPVSLNRP